MTQRGSLLELNNHPYRGLARDVTLRLLRNLREFWGYF
jgi:hypothetical protein